MPYTTFAELVSTVVNDRRGRSCGSGSSSLWDPPRFLGCNGSRHPGLASAHYSLIARRRTAVAAPRVDHRVSLATKKYAALVLDPVDEIWHTSPASRSMRASGCATVCIGRPGACGRFGGSRAGVPASLRDRLRGADRVPAGVACRDGSDRNREDRSRQRKP